jgi:hypothetical protein
MSDPGTSALAPVSMFDPGPATQSTLADPVSTGVTNILHAGATA